MKNKPHINDAITVIAAVVATFCLCAALFAIEYRIDKLDSRLSSLESPTYYYDTIVYDPTSLIYLRAKHQHLLEPLQLTFEEIESECNPAAWNKATDAVGLYQIRKIKVRELNRIQDEVTFSYDDRWDKSLSEMMFDFDMLLNNEYLFSGDPVATIERACRIWNGKHASPSYISRATNLYLDILNHQE